MRWSEEITLAFVKMYLKHECLWNPKHPKYTLRKERSKAYSAFLSEFQEYYGTNMFQSVPEIKLKVKSLRSTYSQEIQKILHNSSPDSMYEPRMKWFHEMDRCLRNITSMNQTKYHREIPDAGGASEVYTKNDSDTQNEDSEELPDPLDEESCSVDTPIKQRNGYKKVKRKKFKCKRTYYTSSSNDEETYIHHRNGDDEFEIYGRFIASQLRQMKLEKALRLQLEIQSLVSEARISDLT